MWDVGKCSDYPCQKSALRTTLNTMPVVFDVGQFSIRFIYSTAHKRSTRVTMWPEWKFSIFNVKMMSSVIECWKRTVQVRGYGVCRFGDIVLGDSGTRIAFIVTRWHLERTCSWVGPVCCCLQICSGVGPGRVDTDIRITVKTVTTHLTPKTS